MKARPTVCSLINQQAKNISLYEQLYIDLSPYCQSYWQ